MLQAMIMVFLGLIQGLQLIAAFSIGAGNENRFRETITYVGVMLKSGVWCKINKRRILPLWLYLKGVSAGGCQEALREVLINC
jgi:hypothetical protein